jgi:hypothetical protein
LVKHSFKSRSVCADSTFCLVKSLPCGAIPLTVDETTMHLQCITLTTRSREDETGLSTTSPNVAGYWTLRTMA